MQVYKAILESASVLASARRQKGAVELAGQVGGGGLDKVVSIAEIVKRKLPDIQQETFFSEFDVRQEAQRLQACWTNRSALGKPVVRCVLRTVLFSLRVGHTDCPQEDCSEDRRIRKCRLFLPLTEPRFGSSAFT